MSTVPLGLYLWTRIKQVGVSHIFGVPGDFNMTLLDHIYNVDGLEWVGSTNELNAAYAADGYARTTRGAGCVVTTHGVGEMSCINAIAGSMTEQVKVIHVVGQTSRGMQHNHMMIHHSVGFHPDHQAYNTASKGFRVDAAELQDENGAAEEIDRVLRECFVQSGPVYVFVPIDIVDLPVSADRLKTPIDLEPSFDSTAVKDASDAILNALYSSKCPAVFVDCLTHRYGVTVEARQLVDRLQIPVFSSIMGKAIIDETNPHFVGLYNGDTSVAGVSSAFEACDNVLILGNLNCDTNSGGFTRTIADEKGIFVHQNDVRVKKDKTFHVPIKQVLRSVLENLDPQKMPRVPTPKLPERPLEDDHDSQMITQSWIWNYLAENFFQPHDVIVGETGTSAFGLADATFPAHVQWITQAYWGSIGYATPAAMGAETALAGLAGSSSSSSSSSSQNRGGKHARGRTVLVTGDGSMMLTIQEIGNMVKHNLQPIIFVINNAGYTVERVIHGARQSYNDIVPLDYSHMLPFFHMSADQAKKSFHRATTKAELQDVLKSDSLRNPTGVQIVEVVMDWLDVPASLSMQVALRGPESVAYMKDAGFKVRDLPKHEAFWV